MAQHGAHVFSVHVNRVLVGRRGAVAEPHEVVAMDGDSLPADGGCGEHDFVGGADVFGKGAVSVVRDGGKDMHTDPAEGPGAGGGGDVGAELDDFSCACSCSGGEDAKSTRPERRRSTDELRGFLTAVQR